MILTIYRRLTNDVAPSMSGRTTPTLEQPYPDSPRRPACKTRAQPRLYSALSREVEDTSACPTVRPSPRSRDPIRALFDVRLEPWEVDDPEEKSYKDHVGELRASLAAESQRLQQHARAAELRAKELDILAREKARPLRDPFAILDHSPTTFAGRLDDSPAQSPTTGCECEGAADVSCPHIFIPLRRFSND